MERPNNLGKIIKQQRLVMELTLKELAATSGISASYLGRIERGERYPSANILRKIAKPLGFEEGELFTLAGYLSTYAPSMAEPAPSYGERQLDPYVARVLSQEPVEVQRTVVGLLTILKNIARTLK
ncbi:helix-turn-helix domain-containing protein [Chloroflexota bacterium]